MSDSTPTTAARAFFEALERRDWVGAAALADPEWATVYGRRQIGFLAVTAMMEGGRNPDAVPEGASGSLTAIPEDSATIAELVEKFGHHRWRIMSGAELTLTELAAAAPTRLLALRFEGLAALTGNPSTPISWQILGEVIENDSVAFVIYRGSYAGLRHPTDADILHMRRTPDGWRYRLTDQQEHPALGMILRFLTGPDPDNR